MSGIDASFGFFRNACLSHQRLSLLSQYYTLFKLQILHGEAKHTHDSSNKMQTASHQHFHFGRAEAVYVLDGI